MRINVMSCKDPTIVESSGVRIPRWIIKNLVRQRLCVRLPNVLGQPTIAMFDVAFPRIQLVPYSGHTTPRHVNMTAVLLKIPGPEYGTYASNDEEHSESSVGQFVLEKTL
jgi:hypothetical protein